MSHFVVMVTRTDEEPLDSQLEPFYEQGDENDYFMEKEYYVENTPESIEGWLSKETKMCEEILKDKKIDSERKKYRNRDIKKLEKIKALKTTKGKLDAIHKYEGGGIDKNGLYWLNNPNAKWDWWSEGGRWNNWLVRKDGTKCNRCLVKELDLDGMRKADMEEYGKYYDNEIREAKEAGREPMFWGFDKVPTREEYVAKADNPAPYAVLHDGEWIEKGEMGWWGTDDPHYTEEEWISKFQEFLKTLDPETEITIVDCHI